MIIRKIPKSENRQSRNRPAQIWSIIFDRVAQEIQ